jgi:hypothetical protein
VRERKIKKILPFVLPGLYNPSYAHSTRLLQYLHSAAPTHSLCYSLLIQIVVSIDFFYVMFAHLLFSLTFFIIFDHCLVQNINSNIPNYSSYYKFI